MSARTCIHCGCSDDRACRIRTAELPPAAREVVAREQLLVPSLGASGTVPCWWVSLNPPVCSAPACVKKGKTRGGGRRRRAWWKVVQLDFLDLLRSR